MNYLAWSYAMEHDSEDFINPVGLGRFLLIFLALCAPAIGYLMAELMRAIR